ncbi:MAG: DUF370 domain-containing protein [Firmicutes bacterium]|nr:DUF370 domain-containing protein [Bacillota bacterium]
MYLHIGHDTMLEIQNIIAIINKNLMDHSPDVRQMIYRYRSLGVLEGDLTDAKSLILTKDRIILSSISASTLYKRANRSVSKSTVGSVWYTEM